MKSNLKNINNLEYSIKEFDIDQYTKTIFDNKSDAYTNIKRIIENFKYNIHSAITIMRLPYLIAIENENYQKRLEIAINSGLTVDDKDEIEKFYIEYMLNNWEENKYNVDKELMKINNRVGIRGNYLKDNLLQGTVHLWSCFEVLIKDYIMEIVNNSPEKAIDLMLKNDYLKKRIKEPSFELLNQYKFDMHNVMGYVLLNEIDFSNYRIVFNMNKTFFDNKLIDDKIFELNQIRHLVVHRSGIIDEKYNNKNNTKYNIGERIDLKAKEIYQYIESIALFLKMIFCEEELVKYFV